MCISGAAAIASAVIGAYGAYDSKRTKAKAKRAADNMPPPVDAEAQAAAARRRSLLARGRSAGGYGTGSTFQTGPGGIPSSGGKGAKTLLGQ